MYLPIYFIYVSQFTKGTPKMKSTLILTMVIAVLAGCQQSSSDATTQSKVQPSAPAASPSTREIPVRFEVRDFKLDEQKESYGTTTNGRGTLVTKDDALKKGSYMVWLSVKLAQKNDETQKQLVLLRDGIGTIETFEYISSEDRDKKKVMYFDWKIIGFVKLQDGVIEVDEPVDAK